MSNHTVWKVVGSLAATAAGVAARKTLERSWTAVQERPPPKNVSRAGVRWREALMWAAASATVVAAARLFARYAAGKVERRVTGDVEEP